MSHLRKQIEALLVLCSDPDMVIILRQIHSELVDDEKLLDGGLYLPENRFVIYNGRIIMTIDAFRKAVAHAYIEAGAVAFANGHLATGEEIVRLAGIDPPKKGKARD